MMSQFGGKVPPPWQTRSQTSHSLQTSLLGQHPGGGSGIPNPQLIIGTAPQAPQYSSIQQSIIQPPGLGGLQTMHNIPQSSICPTSLAQPGQTTIVQTSLQGGTSLMGQPPINSQSIQTSNLTSSGQLATSQIQQIQPQVTTVAYPTPRTIGPPGSFSSQGVPVNVGGNMAAALGSLPGAGIITGGSLNGSSVQSVGSSGSSQPAQKQRVFTGTITKLCADFGFVDEDVFFQTSCVKGHAPKVADRVLVEATYNHNMPFKWNANRVQVIPGQINSSSSSNIRSSGQRDSSRSISFNAVPPPNFNNESQSSGTYIGRSIIGQRPRSPRRDRRDDLKRGPRERQEREDKDKEIKRENRKRSRSRDRTRSPPRRRARIVPRYNVQVPKIILHMKEANVLELRKRYSNLYVPSDVFLTRPLWSDTFPAHRSFQFPRPVTFHIMNKDVDPVIANTAVYDPSDINHTFSAKVMLLAVPSIEDIYRRSCALSEDPSDVRSCFVHPTRLINFLVGLKGKNETMAIGGYWSPSLDGPNPDADPNVLIRTAIRSCKALTGIDLSGCTTWYRFAEIYYRRGESTHKGRIIPARVETTVLFLPDVWNICPTKLEWDALQINYRRQLDLKLQNSTGTPPQQQMQQQSDQEEQDEEDGDEKETLKKDPTYYANLDPKTMKVLELRSELDARALNSKGLKSQLIARLTKVLKSEQEKEDQLKSNEELDYNESKKKDEDGKKKDEEKQKKEEEEKKKECEESRKAEEKERCALEKRYTLPEQPMIIVHPSRIAKAGKFDCTTMSLSVLLDYRQEDNKEHSFEVSLFAELFNEMLMRDFSFRIYRALVDAPDKKEEKKDNKEKRDDSKDDKDDKKDVKDEKKDFIDKSDKDKKEKKEDSDEMKEEKHGKAMESKIDEGDEDEDMEEDFEEEMEEEDSKNKEKEKDSKEKEKRNEKKDCSESKKDKKDKKKMVTIDPYLLLSFVYFDQTHTGYIIDKDLEDITNVLGLNLSRAQLKKLVSKVLSRDVLYYRKLTDVSIEDQNKEIHSSGVDCELLAKGNNHLVPVFSDGCSLSDKSPRRSPKNALKEELLLNSPGLVKYEGSMVDVSKLMQQLERSEKARNDTEDKLQELQKELSVVKEEAKKSTDKFCKLSKEVKVSQINTKSMEEELKKAQEDNTVYQRALNQIKTVIRPLCVGIDDEESTPIKEESKVKTEIAKNGLPE